MIIFEIYKKIFKIKMFLILDKSNNLIFLFSSGDLNRLSLMACVRQLLGICSLEAFSL